jgi:hypothetical protein
MSDKIIDAEFIDEPAGEPSLLSQAADLAEGVAKPLERLPIGFGKGAAEKCRVAARIAREVEEDVRELSPAAERLGAKIRKYVNLNPDRGILKR